MKSSHQRASSIATPHTTAKPRIEAWRTPDHITTFVRCLRLLNLHLLQDWPGVTEQTFSTKSALQNLQQRVKCVEWSLYRLFEIYDSNATLEKLRPFFPPTTPLHSLNLRAALYRTLTELKKNGILGRDIVLRKTMLDECKGEKFEEVLATFAILVLKETAVSLNKYVASSISGQLSSTMQLPHLLPLILAHRKSLQQTLKQRNDFEHQEHQYEAFLRDQEAELRRRRLKVGQIARNTAIEDDSSVEDQIRDNWTGDERWAEILLRGVSAGRPLLQRSFQSSWEEVKSGNGTIGSPHPQNPHNLVDDLDVRIAGQETRLRKWMGFQATLENARKVRSRIPKKATPPMHSSQGQPHFDKHELLHFDLAKIEITHGVEMLPTHRRLLRSMEDELATVGRKAPGLGLSNTRDFSAHDREAEPRSTLCANLKAEEPQAIIPTQQSAKAPVEEAAQTRRRKAIVLNKNFDPSNESADASSSAGPPECDSAQPALEQMPDLQQSHPHPATEFAPELSLLPNEILDDDSTPIKLQTSSSLVERTLISMSATRGRNQANSPYKPQSVTATASIPRSPPPQIDHADTLIARTRLSMSLLPNPPTRTRNPRDSWLRPSRTSQVFPVNQFETPGKRSQMVDSSSQFSASTPPDKLFGEEAEYASVFRSRPKVALSPALSPERSVMGLESLLEEGMGDLTLGEGAESFEETQIRGRT